MSLRLTATYAFLLLASGCAELSRGREEEEAERKPKARMTPAIAALLAQGRPGTGGAGSPPAIPPTNPAGSFDTEQLMSYFSDWEPSVACSRDGRYVYQSTTRYGDPTAVSQPFLPLRVSHDGGATWLPDQYVENRRPWEADPVLAVANDDTVFIVYLSLFTPGVSVKKSTDHGMTWTKPIEVAKPSASYPPGWSDKPWIMVAPNSQDVFIGFNASDPYVVVSHDAGLTWTTPIQTANNGRYWYHTGGCVAPNGDAYFATADYRANFAGKTYLDVTRSADNGVTWSNIRVDASEEMPDCPGVPGCYFGFLGPQSTIACDSAGTLMYVYNAGTKRRRPQQLWFSTSTDGITWSTPQRISVADLKVSNGFPQMVAGPTAGDFRVTWQDDRLGGQWNTWFKETRDGGVTWSPDVRLSNLNLNFPGTYKSSAGYDFVFGDYNGMAVDDFGTNHVIWGEGFSYNGPGGTWYTNGW